MSLVFTSHASHWYGIGMTSSYSHCICMTYVISSCSHHDVIAITHESQLQSWCMTDRPLHMTGRPSCDIKVHGNENTCKNVFQHGSTRDDIR